MSAQGEKSVYEIHFHLGKFCLFNRGLMRRTAAALDASRGLRDDRMSSVEGKMNALG
jgi:hypothetical protein